LAIDHQIGLAAHGEAQFTVLERPARHDAARQGGREAADRVHRHRLTDVRGAHDLMPQIGAGAGEVLARDNVEWPRPGQLAAPPQPLGDERRDGREAIDPDPGHDDVGPRHLVDHQARILDRAGAAPSDGEPLGALAEHGEAISPATIDRVDDVRPAADEQDLATGLTQDVAEQPARHLAGPEYHGPLQWGCPRIRPRARWDGSWVGLRRPPA